MNHIVRKCTVCLFLLFIVSGCAQISKGTKDYEEIPPMLSVLTNVAQSAIEQGYFQNGEQSVLDYIAKKKPKYTKWFEERGYKIRVAEVANHAVVMVCDDGKAVFEDTYCSGAFPDKDHSANSNQIGCEITMTKEEIKRICR